LRLSILHYDCAHKLDLAGATIVRLYGERYYVQWLLSLVTILPERVDATMDRGEEKKEKKKRAQTAAKPSK
jgi:hypothetical protein